MAVDVLDTPHDRARRVCAHMPFYIVVSTHITCSTDGACTHACMYACMHNNYYLDGHGVEEGEVPPKPPRDVRLAHAGEALFFFISGWHHCVVVSERCVGDRIGGTTSTVVLW